jgi:hypothetical protein
VYAYNMNLSDDIIDAEMEFTFVVNTLSADSLPTPITIVLNWQATLKK